MLTPILERAAQLGSSDQLGAVRFLPFDVSELIEDRDRMRNIIATEALAAIKHDGAKVILLGGAPFAGLAHSLGQDLDVAILDGVEASVNRLGLGAGRLA
jgi:Asp/Glu/hydantoin racemase